MLPLADVVRQVHRQRMLLRMTQADLARAAGVSQSFVAKLERGRLNPSYEAVRCVLDALDRAASHDDVTARRIMQRDPVWVASTSPVAEAMAAMKEHGYSQLPVVDGGAPVGAISESDILRTLERVADLESVRRQPVRLLMREAFPTVGPDTRRRVLVELLRDHEAVMVVETGRLRGLVTKSDLW